MFHVVVSAHHFPLGGRFVADLVGFVDNLLSGCFAVGLHLVESSVWRCSRLELGGGAGEGG